MSGFRGMLVSTLTCLSLFAAAQSPDQLAAERVLGPRWKQVSRTAGMVFTGTVLSIREQPAAQGHSVPTIQVMFHVDRAIAGVHTDQVIAIREWAGIWPMHRAMHNGQRLLLLFYPRSRLGLTSPVGGPLGQVALDPSGKIVVAAIVSANNSPQIVRSTQQSPLVAPLITVDQLERAIRSARDGKE